MSHIQNKDANNGCDYLHGQLHNRIHNVVIVVLQRLHGLGAGHVGLGHDELDVLGLDSGLVDLVILLLLGDRGVAGGAGGAHLAGCGSLGVLNTKRFICNWEIVGFKRHTLIHM